MTNCSEQNREQGQGRGRAPLCWVTSNSDSTGAWMSRRQRGSRKSSETLTRNPPNFKTMSPKSSINPKHMQSKESYSKVHQNQDATKAVHACFNQVQLCNPMDYSPPGSSVHGILQARMLERVTVPSSRESSQPRD